MIDELTECACGLPMEPIAVGSAYKRCANCDVPHDAPTNRDYVFTKVWRQRILAFFPRDGRAAA